MAISSKKIVFRILGGLMNALSWPAPRLSGLLAARIFSSPRRIPEKESDTALYALASIEFFSWNSHSIVCYEWTPTRPKGKTVLLLHGWESNTGRWQNYVKALLKYGYTVKAFDAPASGRSSGKRLSLLLFSQTAAAFLRERPLPDAVVGHSLGGATAVLASTFLGAPKPRALVLLGIFAESSRVVDDFRRMFGFNRRVYQSVIEIIEERTGLPIDEYSVTQFAARLKGVSGMVIHDLEDRVAPSTEGKAVAESWGVPFVETRGFGHSLQHHTVIKKVIEFLEKEL